MVYALNLIGEDQGSRSHQTFFLNERIELVFEVLKLKI